jgi:hypothetical protein
MRTRDVPLGGIICKVAMLASPGMAQMVRLGQRYQPAKPKSAAPEIR